MPDEQRVLRDRGRLVIRAFDEEFSDPALGKFQSAWDRDPPRLARLAIRRYHPTINAYLASRHKICDMLSSTEDGEYMFTLPEAVWLETGSRRATVYMICTQPEDYLEGVLGLQLEFRFEILPGRVQPHFERI